MRLLVWCSSYGNLIGGGPVLAPLLTAALAERGHEIVVLTERHPATLPAFERIGEVAVHRFTFKQALQSGLKQVTAVLREVASIKLGFKPDISFIFSPGGGDYFYKLTERIHTTPLVIGLHDCFPSGRYQADALLGQLLRSARRVCACSAATLQHAQAQIPELATTGRVIVNALPMPKEGDVPAATLGKDIAYLGRLVPHKGVHFLIDALALLTGRFPELTLSIGGEGPSLEGLRAQAGRLRLAGRVIFRGAIERADISAFLAPARIIVVPSLEEPFGLVALEAAQLGRPVIASAVQGLPEIVRHEETGLLVPPGDPVALADALKTLLLDDAGAARMGLAARRCAASLFRWQDYVAAVETVLDEARR
ncbi:glycosyltransferase family 4 protein [Ancylobacter sp.]|uniref:glycosyltransferase family 4 protein n=1 Tax=Ancylobacter sp. TaxID=1872567 RepID=UPI003D14331B